MQDALARQIVDSLSLTLTAGEQHRMQRDAPASAEAYELYLRANQLLLDVSSWTAAIDAYRRSVELDPRFAPAWARLGRCYRLIGKFGNAAETSTNLARGEQAIKRALEINPELSLAHHLYAYIEVEAGHAREAMVRLLDRVRQAPSEPELFAGLVHCCRYCGLLEASIAAYERAHRLDPAVMTSVAQSFLLLNDWERVLAVDRSAPSISRPTALYHLGRTDEAIASIRPFLDETDLQPRLRTALEVTVAAFESRWEEVIRFTRILSDGGFSDPEGYFHWAGALQLAGNVTGRSSCSSEVSRRGSIQRPRWGATRTSTLFALCPTFGTSSNAPRSASVKRGRPSAAPEALSYSAFQIPRHLRRPRSLRMKQVLPAPFPAFGDV